MEFIDNEKAFLVDKKTHDALWVYNTDSFSEFGNQGGWWRYRGHEHSRLFTDGDVKGICLYL